MHFSCYRGSYFHPYYSLTIYEEDEFRGLLSEPLNTLIHLCPLWVDILSKLYHLVSGIYPRNKMYRANRNTSAELLPPTAHANEFVSQNIFGRWNVEAARRAVSATQLTRPILSPQKRKNFKHFLVKAILFNIYISSPVHTTAWMRTRVGI